MLGGCSWRFHSHPPTLSGRDNWAQGEGEIWGQPYPGDPSQPPQLVPRRGPHCPGGGHRAGSEIPSGRPAADLHPTVEGSAAPEALGAPGAVIPESQGSGSEPGARARHSGPSTCHPLSWYLDEGSVIRLLQEVLGPAVKDSRGLQVAP